MVTQRHFEIVRENFALVAPKADTFVDSLFRNLFEMAPDYREMFPADLSGQRAKMVHMLSFMVSRLSNIEDLEKPLQNLGARHRDYGVTPDQYAVVGVALIRALEEVSGDAFSPAVREAWEYLYEVISNAMFATPIAS